MHGPYTARQNVNERYISYLGNASQRPLDDISHLVIPPNDVFVARLLSSSWKAHAHALGRITHEAISSAYRFFNERKAHFCPAPMTTMMISSPGEMYAGKTLDYTTDTAPITLSWFDERRSVFLTESAQFYLELYLLTTQYEECFTITNSFRKERSDSTHLTEFHHIEFEGCISFEQNCEIVISLLDAMTRHIIATCKDELTLFLSDQEQVSLETSFQKKHIAIMPLSQALELLKKETGDSRYDEYTLKHFGAWEEIKITELVGSHVMLTDYPLFEIPFYHDEADSDFLGRKAKNADIILYRYRETIGSGVRMRNQQLIQEKRERFNLPPKDYDLYLSMRESPLYRQTAGFGLGLQRYLQWLLKLPMITDATLFPRTHYLPCP